MSGNGPSGGSSGLPGAPSSPMPAQTPEFTMPPPAPLPTAAGASDPNSLVRALSSITQAQGGQTPTGINMPQMNFPAHQLNASPGLAPPNSASGAMQSVGQNGMGQAMTAGLGAGPAAAGAAQASGAMLPGAASAGAAGGAAQTAGDAVAKSIAEKIKMAQMLAAGG